MMSSLCVTVTDDVSKLHYTRVIFLNLGPKVDDTYYWDLLLSQQLLPAIRHVSSEFVLENSATTYRVCYAMFSDINISQGSVAMPLRCGGICNDLFIANFLLSVKVKEFLKNVPNSLKYPADYIAHFFEPPCREHWTHCITFATKTGWLQSRRKNPLSFPSCSSAIKLVFHRLSQQKVNVITVIMTFIKGHSTLTPAI